MFVARIILEVMAVLLLAYGFYHEKDLINWENRQIHKFIRWYESKKRTPAVRRQRSSKEM